ncbi:hypothetical protein [Plectonema radiosum]|nr:hypothetical protein [Plectonema radiosum]
MISYYSLLTGLNYKEVVLEVGFLGYISVVTDNFDKNPTSV